MTAMLTGAMQVTECDIIKLFRELLELKQKFEETF
jgi:hypothetical protein